VVAHAECLLSVGYTDMDVAGADRLLVIQSAVNLKTSLITGMVDDWRGNHIAEYRSTRCHDAQTDRRGSAYDDGPHTVNLLV
jgi:hypothetical protein